MVQSSQVEMVFRQGNWDGNGSVLTQNHRQEGLCRAYVHAVAALAGVSTSIPMPDYGIDLSIRWISQRETQRHDAGVQLDLQLRSTTRAIVSGTEVHFDLDVRTYQSLRTDPRIPRILVVLVLPEDERLWLHQTIDELVVRHCAYWHSLRGAAPSTASSSVRIAIPRRQMFTVEALQTFLEGLLKGELP
jgi:Domain of unknown function (DUF4365)